MTALGDIAHNMGELNETLIVFKRMMIAFIVVGCLALFGYGIIFLVGL